MRSNRLRSTVLALALAVAAGWWSGCAELQRAAEDAARQSGDERLAHVIHGTGTLVGGLLPVSYDEEQSIGAAIALQGAALDRRITAVVAENSFATLRSIFDDYQKRIIKLPFHYLRNIVIKRSELMARFKANDVSPLDAVLRIHIPLLFIYGKSDRLINYKYSVMLYESSNGPKELFPIESASHNDTWRVAGRGYETRVLDFFRKHLR